MAFCTRFNILNLEFPPLFDDSVPITEVADLMQYYIDDFTLVETATEMKADHTYQRSDIGFSDEMIRLLHTCDSEVSLWTIVDRAITKHLKPILDDRDHSLVKAGGYLPDDNGRAPGNLIDYYDPSFPDDACKFDGDEEIELRIEEIQFIRINYTPLMTLFENMFIAEYNLYTAEEAIKNAKWTGCGHTNFRVSRNARAANKPAPKREIKKHSKEEVAKMKEKDAEIIADGEFDGVDTGDFIFAGFSCGTRRVLSDVIPGNKRAVFDTLIEARDAAKQYGGKSITLLKTGEYQIRKQATVYPCFRDFGCWILENSLKDGKMKVSTACPTYQDAAKMEVCKKVGRFWEQTQW